MSALDWIIIIAYILGIVGMGFYLGRHQNDIESYYVGDRSFSWWTVGISTMATQTSAISFISIPAFVALREDGGLTWLQYELALPLAMIAAMVFLVPFFRELKLVSIYEYLELRFNRTVRLAVSFMFLLSRGLGTGVALYAAAIVLSVCIGLPLYLTILFVGLATIIYDVAGGIRAVIISDVIQMVVLVAGVFVCIFYAMDLSGGFSNLIANMPDERLVALDPSLGFSGESHTPFWAFLIGGFFLYLSYYGTDQSQAQRGLSAASVSEAKKSLLLNGLCRFPLALLYILLGIAMFSAIQHSAELQQAVTDTKPDYLVPYFILLELPSGLKGVLFAALLAATMSSLDSALNSLSAVTLRDFVEDKVTDKQQLFFIGRITTVIWGILITGFAFIVGDISDTVIEAINKVGSAFYGPILATFIAGILIRRIHARAIIIGLCMGVIINIVLWLAAPKLHWMWWNLIGFASTSLIALVLTKLIPALPSEHSRDFKSLTLSWKNIAVRDKQWRSAYAWLIAYFMVITIVILLLR